MKVLAVVNQKGGSGKTTTAANLAAALADQGRRVLLVDLDPQATATLWLGFEPAAETISSALAGRVALETLVTATGVHGLDLLAGDPWLDVSERRDFDGQQVPQLAVRTAIERSRLDHDVVVVDTPGRLSLLTIATLAAADHVVVPVPAGAMELEHLDTLDDSIAQVRSLNPSLDLLAVVPCGVDLRTILARDVLAALEDRYPGLVTTGLRRTVRAAEAFAHRQPLTRFEPDHPIAADVRDLARQIGHRLLKVLV